MEELFRIEGLQFEVVVKKWEKTHNGKTITRHFFDIISNDDGEEPQTVISSASSNWLGELNEITNRAMIRLTTSNHKAE